MYLVSGGTLFINQWIKLFFSGRNFWILREDSLEILKSNHL